MRTLSRLAFVLTLAGAAACAGGSALPAPSPERLPFADKLDVDFAKMTKSKSGLYTRDLVEGTGALVESGQTVNVRYTGWLNNGTEIDKVDASAKPVSFKLGRRQVIIGWDEGLVGMRVGGKRQLVVPPELGYGPDRKGNIPGDATLVFVVEMISAKY